MKAWMRFTLVLALALAAAAPCGADQLLNRMKARLAGVKDYTCDVTLNATLQQIAVSNMRMTLYYQRPTRVHVEAKEGFALLPEEGLYLGDPIEEMMASYDFEPLGAAAFQGKSCAKYALRAKKDVRAADVSLRLFVDSALALPLGFTGTSQQGGVVTTVFAFRRLQNKYWLPARTTVTFKGAPEAPSRRRGSGSASNSGNSGRAELTFTNYKINTGLPDSLFVQLARAQGKGGSGAGKKH